MQDQPSYRPRPDAGKWLADETFPNGDVFYAWQDVAAEDGSRSTQAALLVPDPFFDEPRPPGLTMSRREGEDGVTRQVSFRARGEGLSALTISVKVDDSGSASLLVSIPGPMPDAETFVMFDRDELIAIARAKLERPDSYLDPLGLND